MHRDLIMQAIAAESRVKLARLKEAWKEKAVMDKAVERGDVSKIKKKKVTPENPLAGHLRAMLLSHSLDSRGG